MYQGRFLNKNQIKIISSRYATGVLPFICPALTNMLTHQEEDADEEEWNPAKAAGVCLMNLASCCEG